MYTLYLDEKNRFFASLIENKRASANGKYYETFSEAVEAAVQLNRKRSQ
jgi:hypothetical protein